MFVCKCQPLLSLPCRSPGNTRLQCRMLKGPLEQSILSSPGDTCLAHGDSDCPQYSHSFCLRQRRSYYPPMIQIMKGFYPLQPFSSRHPRASPPPRIAPRDAQPGAAPGNAWRCFALSRCAAEMRGKTTPEDSPHLRARPARPRRLFHLPARGSFISGRGAMGPLRPPPPRHRLRPGTASAKWPLARPSPGGGDAGPRPPLHSLPKCSAPPKFGCSQVPGEKWKHRISAGSPCKADDAGLVSAQTQLISVILCPHRPSPPGRGHGGAL